MSGYYDTNDPLCVDTGRVDEVLNVRSRIAALLIRAHLFTVHDVMAFLSRRGNRLTNLEGVGPEAAAEVADALADRRKALGC